MIVCITTLNEVRTIRALCSELRAMGFDVLVADAGSRDGTVADASAGGASVLDCPGAPIAPALLAAWKVAEERRPDYVLQMDAGGSHDPGEAQRLVHALCTGLDVVIGSRFTKEARYVGGPIWRPWASRLAARGCNLAHPEVRLTDWTSGYRGFRVEVLGALLARRYRARMHGWQIEVLSHALDLRMRVGEVPITYRSGRSSFGWETAVEAFGVWRRMATRAKG